MPEVESTESDQQQKIESSPRKRIRHRKKQLYENILKQMEFYFSDANLTKDRFLGELVGQEPFVPLDTFLKFNKVRSMTQDVNDIAKAMKHSTLLELSQDRTKVKRKVPLQSYDADSRTVYVESIPVTASRDWLQRVFSDYGPVAYISLPKFKHSQRIKGYAFIEFSDVEYAQKCLSTFTKLGCKLPTCMPPEELSSIKMFSVEDTLEEPLSNKDDFEPPKKKRKSKEKRPQRGLDLKSGNDSDSDKKLDTPTDDENKSVTMQEEVSLSLANKDNALSHNEMSHNELDQEAPRKKKSRKRTKEKKATLGNTEAPKGALWGLQVLAKSEWKALRNKYLNLQRKCMREVKRSLHAEPPRPADVEPVCAAAAGVGAGGGTGGAGGGAGGAGGGAGGAGGAGGGAGAGAAERRGVFVCAALPEPCRDVRRAKAAIKANNVHAVHVDIKEGQSEVIIRFDSAEAANEYCLVRAPRCRVLGEAEQQLQWERAGAARAARRPRGRQRLLARTQHLRFAD